MISVVAEKFSDVTILFSDIVSFTTMAARLNPMEIVNLLNSIYSVFDKLTSIHNVYKVSRNSEMFISKAVQLDQLYFNSVDIYMYKSILDTAPSPHFNHGYTYGNGRHGRSILASKRTIETICCYWYPA